MKASTTIVAIFAATALAFSPFALHAQYDNGGPPPPPDQGAPPPDQGGGDDQGASFDEFYNGLSDQGQWIQTQDYGYVFQPTVQDQDWAPYRDGHWVYTDYGWTWVSDEPWGWATYHYGRWVNIEDTGWVWVPGYQWAPAWVSWRYGGGYCGWAPLPPATFVGVEYGGPRADWGMDFHFGSDVDVSFGIGPAYYNFIAVGDIGEPHYRGHYLDRERNFTVINNTTNVTNIYVTRNSGAAFSAVRVGGPSFETVRAASHTPLEQVRLSAAGSAGVSTVSGGTLSVFRPRINPSTLKTSRPHTLARTLSDVKVNRGTSVSQPLQTTHQFKPTAPSAAAIAEAKAAQEKAPTGVATASRVKSSAKLSQPLTSLPTVNTQHHGTSSTSNINGNTANHTSSQGTQGANANHYTGNGGSNGSSQQQAEHNAQVREQEQQQHTSSSQSQGQSASQQEKEREQALRKQEAQSQQQSQEHSQALHEQQAQQQTQERQQALHEQQSQQQAQERQQAVHEQQVQQQAQEHQQAYHEQQQASQQQAQHYQQQSQPQSQQHSQSQGQSSQQHSSQQSQGGSSQHSGGNNGNGQNKNQNGQNQ